MSDVTQRYVSGFWTLTDDILNAILFLLIGLEVLVLEFDLHLLGIAILSIPLVLLARFLSVGGPILLLARWEPFVPGTIAVLTWERCARRHLHRAGALAAGGSGAISDPGRHLRSGPSWSLCRASLGRLSAQPASCPAIRLRARRKLQRKRCYEPGVHGPDAFRQDGDAPTRRLRFAGNRP